MIMAIEHSGMAVSTDVIKSKLLDMSAEVGSTGNESAFLSKSWQHRKRQVGSNGETSKSKTSSLKTVKMIRCFKCKQVGHYKNQCNYKTMKRKAQCLVVFSQTQHIKEQIGT